MRLIIAGSRDITDYAFLVSCVGFVCVGFGCDGEITEVVSGGARGIDKLAEQYAEELEVPNKIFPADWERLGRSAGYIRNIQMADYADALVAIWDGNSKGTRHMVQVAMEKGLAVYVFTYPGGIV